MMSRRNTTFECRRSFNTTATAGVSKTINSRANATKAGVAAVLRLAYRLKCKGLTVFRTGSREKRVMACANA